MIHFNVQDGKGTFEVKGVKELVKASQKINVGVNGIRTYKVENLLETTMDLSRYVNGDIYMVWNRGKTGNILGQMERGRQGKKGETVGTRAAQDSLTVLLESKVIDTIVAHSNGNHHALMSLVAYERKNNPDDKTSKQIANMRYLKSVTFYGIAAGHGVEIPYSEKQISAKYFPKHLNPNSKLFYHSNDQVIGATRSDQSSVAAFIHLWKKNYGADSVQIRKYPGERPGWDLLDFSPHAISNFWWIREYIRR